jgi:hypothetical protein
VAGGALPTANVPNAEAYPPASASLGAVVDTGVAQSNVNREFSLAGQPGDGNQVDVWDSQDGATFVFVVELFGGERKVLPQVGRYLRTVRQRGTVPVVAQYGDAAAASTPSPAAAAQATWWIDPVAGSNNQSGLTRGTAIRTWAEYSARTGDLPVATSTVNLLGDLPASDPLVPPRIPAGALVVVTGQPGAVALYTSAAGFTATTAQVPATNTAWSATDAAMPANWSAAGPAGSSLVNSRIRVTSGPRAGAVCWAAKDLGGKSARVSFPLALSPAPPFPFGGYPATTLAPGDPFVVERLPVVGDLVFRYPISSDYESNNALLVFDSLSFNPPPPDFTAAVVPDGPGQGAVRFQGCDVGDVQGSAFFAACQHAPFVFWTNGFPNLAACLIQGESTVEPGCAMFLTQDCLVQCGGGTKGIVLHSSVLQDAEVAVFDAVGDGFNLEPGSVLTADSALWGSGNGGYGVRVQGPAGALAWGGTLPTVTGTSGNLVVGGVAKTWAAVAAGFTAPNGAAAWPAG